MIVYLGSRKELFEYETIRELRIKACEYNVIIGYDVRIGDGVSIGDDVIICDDVSIGADVIICNDVSILDGVRIGDDVIILERAKIPSNIKIDKIYHLINEYKYHVSGYGNYIQLGCFTRTIEEWDNDFWNNDRGFPEDSEAGQLRLKAYKKMKMLLETEIRK